MSGGLGLRMVASGFWASRVSCRSSLSRICALPFKSKVMPSTFNIGLLVYPPPQSWSVYGMDDCSIHHHTENLGVRGLSSTPALKGSNFYTVTYEVGESGEKHTVQVKNNKNGRTVKTIVDHRPGKGWWQPAGHCHQQWHRPGWVWCMWRHPGLLHVSRDFHTGMFFASYEASSGV